MKVELREIARYMRMGCTVPEGELAVRVLALRDSAMDIIRPACVWRRFPIADGAITSGEIRLELSGTIARHLDGCQDAFLACGTIGAAFDAFHRRVSVSSGLDALITQAIGAALIEKVMDAAEDDIRLELAHGESLAKRYSPGYGTFPLTAQRPLLALIDATLKVGVSLTDNLLMVPSKSVSAIIGIRRLNKGRSQELISHEVH